MTVRADVAAAVTAANITGLTGVEWAPPSGAPGLCWAQWAGANTSQYADGTAEADDDEWDVLATLPTGNTEATGTATDMWRPRLLSALAPIGRIGRVSAVQLTVGQGTTVPALLIKLYT